MLQSSVVIVECRFLPMRNSQTVK